MRRLVILDLDDTLYPEIDYVRSGFGAVASFLAGRTLLPAATILAALWGEFEADRRQVFDRLLASLDCPGLAAAELVDLYRRHEPEIRLRPEAAILLPWLAPRAHTAVLTDGLAAVQRLKCRALGLSPLVPRIVYTDDLGREAWKPAEVCFRILLEEFGSPARDAVYVADNPAKDFIAPRRLGMRSVRLRTGDQLHCLAEAEPGQAPDCEISSLSSLPEVLESFGWMEQCAIE